MSKKKTIALTAIAAAATTGAITATNAHADATPVKTTTDQTTPVTTPTNANSLKAEQDQTRTAYQDAKTANSAAQDSLAAAQNANSAAQDQVTSASQEASTAQDSQAAAQKTADQAQSEFKQVSDAAKQANDPAAVSEAHQQVTNAQQSAASAANATSDAQNSVAAAQGAVSDAQKMVDGAQSTVNQKTQAVSDAQTNVDAAQTALNNAQKGDSTTWPAPSQANSTIKVDPDWLNILKQEDHDHNRTNSDGIPIESLLGIDSSDSSYKALQAAANNMFATNSYINDATLEKIPFTWPSDGIFDAQTQLYLTRYVANLINPIRQMLGVPLLEITQNSLKYTTNIENQYNADNWDFNAQSHDDAALSKYYASNEIIISILKDNQASITSVNTLLQQIYTKTMQVLCQDEMAEWGHTLAMLNLMGPNHNDTISFSIQGDKYIGLHYDFFTDALAYPTPSPDFINKYNPENNTYDVIDKATGQIVNTVDAGYVDTSAKVSLDYNTDNTSSTDTSAEQATLTKAQDALKQAQTEQTTAQNNLTAAQGALTQANTTLANKQQALKDAQAKQATADQAVKDAQAKVDAMTNAKDALAKAQTKLDATKQALADANTKLAAAQDKLTKAQAAAKTAEATLQDAQAKADAAASDLQKAKDALITDAKVYGESVQVKPIADQQVNSAVPTLEIANPMVKDPTQSAVMDTFLQLATSELDPVPTGTTVAFANVDAVKTMMTTTGVKTADVLITFPDHSTITKQVTFNVVAAPVENPSGSEGAGSQAPSDSQGAASQAPSDSQGAASQAPSDSQDAASQAPSDSQGAASQAPSTSEGASAPSKSDPTTSQAPAATTGSDVKTVVTPSAAKNGQAKVQQVAVSAQPVTGATVAQSQPTTKHNPGHALPQTGDQAERSVLGLGFAGIAMAFGLAFTKKGRHAK